MDIAAIDDLQDKSYKGFAVALMARMTVDSYCRAMVSLPARIVVCAWAASMAAAASAGELYKCVDAAGTAYQSMPCATGAIETRVQVATLARPSLPPDPARRSARKPGPWRHKTLTLGMSDDEVLNMPGWGPPSRITRVRVPRGGWREEWTYDQGLVAEQRLSFANAKLVDIVVVSPEARVAEAAASTRE